jgi:hypothetical protein
MNAGVEWGYWAGETHHGAQRMLIVWQKFEGQQIENPDPCPVVRINNDE